MACLIALVGTGLAAVVLIVTHRIESRVTKLENPFADLPNRPGKESKATNFLLVGSDSRTSGGNPKKWAFGAQRTDAILLVNISGRRDSVNVVSIPRDSWVDVPGHGMNKVNAAYSYGGAPLLIQTVEKLTKVHVDHLMVMDFDGFSAVTDSLGGVTIDVGTSTTFTGKLHAGRQRLNGSQALSYVRERYGLPNGDFDRVKRQQNWMRAIFSELLSKGTLLNPVKLTNSLEKIAENVAVDEGFTFGKARDLASGLRGIRADDLRFTTVPVTGTGTSKDGQSIVKLDSKNSGKLFEAMAGDSMNEWFKANQGALLGSNVN
ncbi:LCP family protein [Streptomyces pathocidini]|uniref:LCP family protein n=1 Tax=Streptomyces pathocidini TaxID=1650571 RepID=A0ABW7UP63_9ACTN|nr:LCP family protein [Streptomyces pathocidini]